MTTDSKVQTTSLQLGMLVFSSILIPDIPYRKQAAVCSACQMIPAALGGARAVIQMSVIPVLSTWNYCTTLTMLLQPSIEPALQLNESVQGRSEVNAIFMQDTPRLRMHCNYNFI